MDFKNKKLILKKIIYYLIGFLPLTVTLFAYPHIPEQIPAHYSTMGEIARLGNKGEVLIIPFLLAIFTYVKPRIFKNKFLTEAENEISSFATLLFMMSVNFLSYLQVFTSINGAILTKFNFYNLLSSIICFIFIFLGYIFSN
ncbi:MAG: DUF1648 domain-containing protein, partial [Intestinibacter sp.]